MTQLPVEYPRPIDQEVLDLLRHSPGMTIQELTAQLGVTATAVRQRLERLERSGCVAREKEIAGRGRPVYRYRVTPLGGRFAGVSYAELATAMWNEILEIEDAELRDHLIGRIAHRLGRSLRVVDPAEADLDRRMTAAAEELVKRRVAAAVHSEGELPVLEVHTCPFPELVMAGQQRELCEMEEAMLSEAVGQSVHLHQCRLDGHEHCQFRPVDS